MGVTVGALAVVGVNVGVLDGVGVFVGVGILAIARKQLIPVWNVLMKDVVDKHHDPRDVAYSFFKLAYAMKVRNLPDNMSAREFTCQQLDCLGIESDFKENSWSRKKVKQPPSRLLN